MENRSADCLPAFEVDPGGDERGRKRKTKRSSCQQAKEISKVEETFRKV